MRMKLLDKEHRKKRIWGILAAALFLAIVVFSVQGKNSCNAHRLYVNDQPIFTFESPEAALSSMTVNPLLSEENWLSLSCEGGRPAHDIQLYIRLAREKDGMIAMSPNATLCNFSPTQDEAAFTMNDILRLDEDPDYDLVLFELVNYEKTPPAYQYAVFRWIDS